MCDYIRPNDPITFIANFMLMNKETVRKLEDVVKDFPEVIKEKEVLLSVISSHQFIKKLPHS